MAALADFAFTRRLTINTTSSGANVASSLTSFPVCVVVDGTSWGTLGATHWFNSSNTSGKRVQFFDSSGTNLSYEVESYDSTGSTAFYWVKVPTVNGNSTTTIDVGYGSDPNGADQSNGTAVWDANYVAVYHLNPDLGQTVDSTSNGNTLTDNASASGTTGQIAKGAQFDGTDDYFETNYVLPTSNFTFAAWGSSSSTQGFANRIMGNADSTAGLNGADIIWRSSANTLYAVYRGGASGTNGGVADISATVSNITTGWHHVASSVDSSAGAVLYYDGASVGTKTANTSIASTLTFRIGRDGNGSDKFNGYADEVRISTTTRSADWIKAEYFSTKKTTWNGDGWISVGPEQFRKRLFTVRQALTRSATW